MFTHPAISSEVARYRQQEMVDQARRHQAAQLRAHSRESQPARRTGWQLGRYLRSVPAQWRRTARA